MNPKWGSLGEVAVDIIQELKDGIQAVKEGKEVAEPTAGFWKES